MPSVFQLLLWPIKFIWGNLKAIVWGFYLMTIDVVAGLLSLGWVLLKLAGSVGLVVSVVWAFTMDGSSLSSFLMSCVRHGVVWLAAGSVVMLGISALLFDLANERCNKVDYRRDVRMRRRVDHEEAEHPIGR